MRLGQEQESLSLSLADCSRMGCSSRPLAVAEATEIHVLDCLSAVQAGPSEKRVWRAVVAVLEGEMRVSRILVGGSSCFQHLLSFQEHRQGWSSWLSWDLCLVRICRENMKVLGWRSELVTPLVHAAPHVCQAPAQVEGWRSPPDFPRVAPP